MTEQMSKQTMTKSQLREAINGLGPLAPDWLVDALEDFIELQEAHKNLLAIHAEDAYHLDEARAKLEAQQQQRTPNTKTLQNGRIYGRRNDDREGAKEMSEQYTPEQLYEWLINASAEELRDDVDNIQAISELLRGYDALQARIKELEVSFSKQYGDMKTEIDRLTIDNSLLEAQRDELLEAIERYINGYLNGNPMPILIDFLAEAHDKIETDRKSNA